MLSEEELEVLRLFACACGDADLGWTGTIVDPPDAVSRDGTVGLELTRLAPGGAGQGGSPTTRRQTLRDRVLSGAQRVLEGDPGRGFRVHAVWDDGPELWPSDVGTLSQTLAEAARGLRGEAMRRAADEMAGD